MFFNTTVAHMRDIANHAQSLSPLIKHVNLPHQPARLTWGLIIRFFLLECDHGFIGKDF